MKIRDYIARLNKTVRHSLTWLGLTRAEAAFILFLSSAALAGALIASIQPPFAGQTHNHFAPKNEANRLFKILATSDSTDSGLIDSLLLYFSPDSDARFYWAKKSDSLRRMLENRSPLSAVDSFISSSGDEPIRKININTANLHTLTLLPGVGPKTAEHIIAYREQHGPFRRPEDLMKIRGIGKKTFAKLKPYIDI